MSKNNTFSFTEILSNSISNYGSKEALAFIDESPITYSQMGEKITSSMAMLENFDIKPGDRVIIYSQNMPNWAVIYFALQKMGVVAVPVLPDFNPHELQNVLIHSEAKCMFVSESLEYKLSDVKSEYLKTTVRIDNFEVIGGDFKDYKFV